MGTGKLSINNLSIRKEGSVSVRFFVEILISFVLILFLLFLVDYQFIIFQDNEIEWRYPTIFFIFRNMQSLLYGLRRIVLNQFIGIKVVKEYHHRSGTIKLGNKKRNYFWGWNYKIGNLKFILKFNFISLKNTNSFISSIFYFCSFDHRMRIFRSIKIVFLKFIFALMDSSLHLYLQTRFCQFRFENFNSYLK